MVIESTKPSDFLSITGKVRADLASVSKGVVLLFGKQDGIWEARQLAAIVSGTYQFDSLPTGKYIIYAIPQHSAYTNYLPTYFVNSFLWRGAYEFDLKTSLYDADITLIALRQSLPKGTASISGSMELDERLSTDLDVMGGVEGLVLGRAAQAMPSMPVILSDRSGKPLAWTLTDSEGKYTFAELPFGEFKVMVEKASGENGESGPVVLSPAQSQVELDPIRISAPDAIAHAATKEAEGDVILFPNPCWDQLKVVLNEGAARIIIYNTAGWLVAEQELPSGSGLAKLDVSTLPSGLYTLCLKQGHVSRFAQFSKQ